MSARQNAVEQKRKPLFLTKQAFIEATRPAWQKDADIIASLVAVNRITYVSGPDGAGKSTTITTLLKQTLETNPAFAEGHFQVPEVSNAGFFSDDSKQIQSELERSIKETDSQKNRVLIIESVGGYFLSTQQAADAFREFLLATPNLHVVFVSSPHTKDDRRNHASSLSKAIKLPIAFHEQQNTHIPAELAAEYLREKGFANDLIDFVVAHPALLNPLAFNTVVSGIEELERKTGRSYVYNASGTPIAGRNLGGLIEYFFPEYFESERRSGFHEDPPLREWQDRCIGGSSVDVNNMLTDLHTKGIYYVRQKNIVDRESMWYRKIPRQHHEWLRNELALGHFKKDPIFVQDWASLEAVVGEKEVGQLREGLKIKRIREERDLERFRQVKHNVNFAFD